MYLRKLPCGSIPIPAVNFIRLAGMQETIDARFNDLTERLDELGRGLASPATLHSLEFRLDDIYGRIEQSRPEVRSIDPAMLDGLEAQVARLAAQLSGSATAGAGSGARSPH